MADHTMEPPEWLCKQLEAADPDLLRQMVRTFAEQLMSAEVEAICGAAYNKRSPERINARNGYRASAWDTRVGTVELGVPTLREGSYFPDWLLVPRRRAEQALTSVIADAYLAGVSTRRGERLCAQLGIEHMSKSQVSRLAADLDEIVCQFRSRPLEQGPYAYLSLDALVVKVLRGRADRQRLRGARGWGQRRRVPRESRPGCGHHRGRGILDGVPSLPGGTRPYGSAPGDL